MSTKSHSAPSSSVTTPPPQPPSNPKTTPKPPADLTPARRYLTSLSSLHTTLTSLAADRPGLDALLSLESSNSALSLSLMAARTEKTHYRDQLQSLQRQLDEKDHATHELTTRLVTDFARALDAKTTELKTAREALARGEEHAALQQERHIIEKKAAEKKLAEEFRAETQRRDAEMRALREELAAARREREGCEKAVRKLKERCYRTETMLRAKEFEIEEAEAVRRELERAVGVVEWAPEAVGVFAAGVEKLADDCHAVLKEFVWENAVFSAPPPNILQQLEESGFAAGGLPVFIADSALSRLTVLARTEQLLAATLLDIFATPPLPRIPDDPAFRRDAWTPVMVGVSNTLFAHSPTLEAQWRALTWKGLSTGDAPVNNTASFLAQHLQRFLTPLRPLLTPEHERGVAPRVRSLLEDAHRLWTPTFAARERVLAKMPEVLDGDEITPRVDAEYSDDVAGAGSGGTSDAAEGAGVARERTTWGLWPEIAVARTPHPADRARDYLEVVYPGKALDDGCGFLRAARRECGRLKAEVRAREGGVVERAGRKVGGLPRRYSVSRGGGVGIGVPVERVVAKRQRVEREVVKVETVVMERGGGVGLGQAGRAAAESSA